MRRTTFCLVLAGLAACGSPPEAAPPVAEALAFRVPTDAEIPEGPVGVSIRRGRAILASTRDSLPDYVGNRLNCTSCHLENGTLPHAAPWVGIYSRFPQYRSRNAKVNLIEDRINDCFERSLVGKGLPRDGRDMTDIIAYMAFLSRDVAPPGEVPGQGFRQLEPLVPDTVRGRLLYVQQCARCHGANGEGMVNPHPDSFPAYYPPLWGAESYSIGAGMARLRTAAAFLRANMPFDAKGSLSDQEAFDIAGYMVSRSRPDFARKAEDWPKGDPPPDVAYPTKAGRAPAGR
ncbi:MAG: c-type cytochrome [Gemmatimonadales bacterium]|nr:c-type cytochrome [Gemmatimonadales bacterium]